MREIRLQARAKRDLLEIWEYTFQRWGEGQADGYLDALAASMERLRSEPEIGPACEEIRVGYRSLHVNRHVVFYRVSDQTIRVVRVLHDRMLPQGRV